MGFICCMEFSLHKSLVGQAGNEFSVPHTSSPSTVAIHQPESMKTKKKTLVLLWFFSRSRLRVNARCLNCWFGCVLAFSIRGGRCTPAPAGISRTTRAPRSRMRLDRFIQKSWRKDHWSRVKTIWFLGDSNIGSLVKTCERFKWDFFTGQQFGWSPASSMSWTHCKESTNRQQDFFHPLHLYLIKWLIGIFFKFQRRHNCQVHSPSTRQEMAVSISATAAHSALIACKRT